MLRAFERRRHPVHLENLDDDLSKDYQEEIGRQIEYDEVISENEKEDLHELIEWMSVEQTIMMTCLGSMCLAVLVICAMKLCAA